MYLVVGGKVGGKSRLMAAALWGGEGAMVTGSAAAWLYGLTDSPPPTIDVTVTRKRQSPLGIRVHVDRRLGKKDRALFDSIPVPRVERLLFDLCGSLPASSATRIVDVALRNQLTDLLRLTRSLENYGHNGKRGTATLRKILTRRLALGITDSDAEDLFARMAERRGFKPIHHFVVADKDFYAELDFAMPEFRIDIEIDGRDHENPVQRDRDRERDVELGRRGWVVLRFTYRDLVERPEWVFDSIARVIQTRVAS